MMLILKRNKKESIIIGNDIKVTMLNYKNGQFKIGIDAPEDISVHREEIYLKIREKCANIKTR